MHPTYSLKILTLLATIALVLTFMLAGVTVVHAETAEPDFANSGFDDGTIQQTSEDAEREQDRARTIVPNDITSNYATRFIPLVGLPGITDKTETRTLAGYLNALFRLAIGLGALAAVIRITYAGIKYMTSDRFYSKEEAKKDIQNSLLGLLIILSTVVILNVIYPDILNLNVLQQLTSIAPPVSSPGATDCSGSASGADIITACSTQREKIDFYQRCKDTGVVTPGIGGIVECVGSQTATSTAANDTLTRFADEHPGVSDATTRNIIQNIVNTVPENASEVEAAWRAANPAYQDPTIEVLFVVEQPGGLDARELQTIDQQIAVCNDWDLAAGSGSESITFEGKQYLVCARGG